MTEASTARLTRTALHNASALGSGGGMFVSAGSRVDLSGTSIQTCTAADGGGVAVEALGEVHFRGSSISGNSATSAGGALRVQSSASAVLTASMVASNQAALGALASVTDEGVLVMSSVVARSNSAPQASFTTISGSHGSLYCDSAAVSVTNTSIQRSLPFALECGMCTVASDARISTDNHASSTTSPFFATAQCGAEAIPTITSLVAPIDGQRPTSGNTLLHMSLCGDVTPLAVHNSPHGATVGVLAADVVNVSVTGQPGCALVVLRVLPGVGSNLPVSFHVEGRLRTVVAAGVDATYSYDRPVLTTTDPAPLALPSVGGRVTLLGTSLGLPASEDRTGGAATPEVLVTQTSTQLTVPCLNVVVVSAGEVQCDLQPLRGEVSIVLVVGRQPSVGLAGAQTSGVSLRWVLSTAPTLDALDHGEPLVTMGRPSTVRTVLAPAPGLQLALFNAAGAHIAATTAAVPCRIAIDASRPQPSGVVLHGPSDATYTGGAAVFNVGVSAPLSSVTHLAVACTWIDGEVVGPAVAAIHMVNATIVPAVPPPAHVPSQQPFTAAVALVDGSGGMEPLFNETLGSCIVSVVHGGCPGVLRAPQPPLADAAAVSSPPAAVSPTGVATFATIQLDAHVWRVVGLATTCTMGGWPVSGTVCNEVVVEGCPAGSGPSATVGGRVCVPCSAGYYGTGVDAGDCVVCPPGTVSSPGAAACTPCLNGTAAQGAACEACSPTEVSTGTVCTACPAGHLPDPATRSECVPCYAGSVRPTSSSICRSCGAGTYADVAVDASACLPCPDGTVSTPGSSSCDACTAGTAPSLTADRCEACGAVEVSNGTACVVCAAGFVPDPTTRNTCQPCFPGAVRPASSSLCTVCPNGKFASVDHTTCVDCPAEGVQCRDGRAEILPGYWLISDLQGTAGGGASDSQASTTQALITNASKLYKCPADSCHIQDSGEPGCLPGRSGPLCAICGEGYYLDGTVCSVCPESSVNWPLLVLMAMGLVGVCGFMVSRATTLWKRNMADPDTNVMPVIKVAVNYLQISGFMADFEVPWPAYISNMWSASNSVSTVPLSASFITCTIRWSFYDQFWMLAAAPLVTALLLLAIPAARRLATGRADLLEYRAAVLATWYLVYPAVTRQVVKVFECSSSIAGVKYLVADYTQECGSIRHLVHVVAGVCVVIGFCVGYPLAVAWMLRARRNAGRLHKKSTQRQFLFLYQGYRAETCWWESVVIARKLGLAVAGSMLGESANGHQAYVALLVVFVSLGAHLVFNPYDSASQGRLETVSLTASGLALYLGLLYTLGGLGQTGAAVAGGTLICVHAAFLTLMVVSVVQRVWRLARRSIKQKRLGSSRASARHLAPAQQRRHAAHVKSSMNPMHRGPARSDGGTSASDGDLTFELEPFKQNPMFSRRPPPVPLAAAPPAVEAAGTRRESFEPNPAAQTTAGPRPSAAPRKQRGRASLRGGANNGRGRRSRGAGPARMFR